MLGIKVNNKNAEFVRRYLKGHKLLDKRYIVLSRDSFIYFPISHKPSRIEKGALLDKGANPANELFRRHTEHKGHRELIREVLNNREYQSTVKGLDILGSIAIIDVEPKFAKLFANSVLRANKNVGTVLRKGGALSGRYRKRSYIFVSGKRSYRARYKENGCIFEFDVRRTFFSNRLAYERKRIVDLSKNGEHVIVMFAGVGPFAIEIAKKNSRSKIIAVELNKYAYKYMLENIRINKVKNVVPVLADANKISVKYGDYADRIIMPLPKDSHRFLNSAITAARNNCIIHYYAFDGTDEYSGALAAIRSTVKEFDAGFRVVNKRVVRPYSADTSEVVIDFVLHKHL